MRAREVRLRSGKGCKPYPLKKTRVRKVRRTYSLPSLPITSLKGNVGKARQLWALPALPSLSTKKQKSGRVYAWGFVIQHGGQNSYSPGSLTKNGSVLEVTTGEHPGLQRQPAQPANDSGDPFDDRHYCHECRQLINGRCITHQAGRRYTEAMWTVQQQIFGGRIMTNSRQKGVGGRAWICRLDRRREEFNATHIDRLLFLLLGELSDSHKRLRELV